MSQDNLINHYKEGIKLYNSQSTSKQMLKDNFVIRLKEYQKLWQVIKNSPMLYPEQHYIIQGVRGSGKTTLLSRLALAVEEEPSLASWLIPIVFKEEEFGISSLFTFWARVAEELADYALDEGDEADVVGADVESDFASDFDGSFYKVAEGVVQYVVTGNDKRAFDGIVDAIDALEDNDPKAAINIINSRLQSAGKKIILFIDNLVELFAHFSDVDEAILREVLITNSNIRLIGGSAVSLEAFYDHQAPFYQFFAIVNLKGLNQTDTHALLQKLGEHEGPEEQAQIEHLLAQAPERIESIRRLTDGIPRTIVILFNILLEGPKGNTFALLEDTIDKTTPLYKHRMEDLSKQQKPIVNAIALNWDAISAKEIAEKTRLDSKQISAQLSQLEKNWIVEKIPTNTKNHLYAIKERFFNIWYLLRYGRRKDKNKVLWLTRFFEIWCSPAELQQRSKTFISQLDHQAHPKAALTYANALLCSSYIPFEDKTEIFTQMTGFLQTLGDKSLGRELLPAERSEDEKNMAELITGWVGANEVIEASPAKMDLLHLLNAGGDISEAAISSYCDTHTQAVLSAAITSLFQYFNLSAIPLGWQIGYRFRLTAVLDKINAYDEAISQLKHSLTLIEQSPTPSNDWLPARQYIHVKLGRAYFLVNDLTNAEFHFLEAEKFGAKESESRLAVFYLKKRQFELAESYAKKAIATNHPEAFVLLGVSLVMQERFEEAQAVFAKNGDIVDKALKQYTLFLYQYYADILMQQQKPQGAKILVLQALQIDPEAITSLAQLATIDELAGDLTSAKHCCQQLIKLGQGHYIAELIEVMIELKPHKLHSLAFEKRIKQAVELAISQTEDQALVYNHAAWVLFEHAILKALALSYSNKAQLQHPSFADLQIHIIILLWNNELKRATEQMICLLDGHLASIDELEADLIDLLILFLAKSQTNLVDQWLKKYQLTERFKPLYYALMVLMREQYPNEILRMGAELKQTVDEILEKIKRVAERYH